MRLVDTHCHLDMPQYREDLEEVIKRSGVAGVERIIVPGISVSSTKAARDMARDHEEIFFAAGVHPHEADRIDDAGISEIRSLACESDKLVAIGEVGLDHYKNYASGEAQRSLFKKMCRLAFETDLPLVIHSRNAFDEVFSVIEEVFTVPPRGVMHCFGYGAAEAEKAVAKGFYISFATNLTYPGARELKEALSAVPAERLLLETDGPYLAPDGMRGKRNSPENVRHLLDILSKSKSLSPADIARITTHNANQLFRLGISEPGKVAYPIRDALYLNITNRCTNRCRFCTRYRSCFVKGHRLNLEREPRAEEVIASLGDLASWKEVVFCGFGEPTLRMGVIKRVAEHIKRTAPSVPVRLVTNGHGDLINGRDITLELAPLIDKLSVSLNAPDETAYNEMMRPVFKDNVFASVMDFAARAGKAGMDVEITALDIIGRSGMDRIGSIAQRIGARMRVRKHNEVG